jgi:hypothetical protein
MSVIINGSAGVTTNSGAVYDGISRGTVATASGTSVDFTSIPSWVERITVMFSGVSTNGTSSILIQLGDSGGIENTGYVAYNYNANGPASLSSTAGFPATAPSAAAAIYLGHIQITNLNGNSWVGSSIINATIGVSAIGAGTKTLSDVLTQIRITTVNGTDTFDAGSINILYE